MGVTDVRHLLSPKGKRNLYVGPVSLPGHTKPSGKGLDAF